MPRFHRLHYGEFGRSAAVLGWVLLWTSISVWLLSAASGCSRGFYRRQADVETYALIDRAACATGGSSGSYGIEPDATSRMYDPDCPDRPPMPPDDPVAHRLMQCVDSKPGWPGWNRNGETPRVENPDWRAYLPRDDQGRVVLDRAEAMRLALLHSPDYQQQLEDLYLSALSVTLERFRFDVQFFGDNSTFFTADGPARVAGSSSQLSTDTDLQMRKLFATGGELVVGMANSLVWQFAGPDTYGANTLLDFSLVQPLLRAGGRDVVLESLTGAERDLLAEIRSMERFRRTFYTQITAAYLRVLEQQVEIRNQRSNVGGLRASLDRLEALFDVDQIAGFDVNLTRQNLYASQSQLLRLNKSYRDSLDAFKLLLGLPPDLDVKLEDPVVARFELIDPSLTAMHEAVSEFAKKLRDPTWEEADHPDNVRLLATLRNEVLAELEMVDRDFERLLDTLRTRAEQLGRLSQRPDLRRGDVDPKIADIGELYGRVVDLSDRLDGVEAKKEMARQLGVELEEEDEEEEEADPLRTDRQKFTGVAESLNALLDSIDSIRAGAPVPDEYRDKDEEGKPDIEPRQEWLGDQLTEISSRLLELSLIQAWARLDVIMLPPVEIDPGKGFEIARVHRRDWMNARAELVDAWRQIEVVADDLESDLDVTFSGDISSTQDEPFRFRGTTGRLRAGLAFDAPLTRLAERNAYRRSLIAYQQQRRDYYRFEDGVAEELRDVIRTIQLSELDFEVQRVSVWLAVSQVDLARETLKKPPKPGGSRTDFSDNAARDVIDALRALLAAQNGLLRVWVGQEIDRMNLDRDLGTMELDPMGVWIDPGSIGSTKGPDKKSLQSEAVGVPPQAAAGDGEPPGDVDPPMDLQPPSAIELPEEVPLPLPARPIIPNGT